MSSYSEFSSVYDRLMTDVDYKSRTEYLLGLFEKYGKVPTLLLDVACGTGGFSNQFALKGIEVIGVDMSAEMLDVARDNSSQLGVDILYLCQKAEELDLYGTVNGAICCLDSINHITEINTLKTALKKISLFLEKDCIFIFDINTPFKHREILGNNTFVFEEDDIFGVWQNQFNDDDLTVDISLDFFQYENGAYTRYSEDFTEKAYTDSELNIILKEAGFQIMNVFEDMTQTAPKEDCERKIYVVKKK